MVLRRIHHDHAHGSGRRLTACECHQIHAVAHSRRCPSRDAPDHVFVTRQRHEPVLLVLVDRRLVAEPAVRRIWVIEEDVGEGVELDRRPASDPQTIQQPVDERDLRRYELLSSRLGGHPCGLSTSGTVTLRTAAARPLELDADST